ncbi:MAG: hypothetical protein U0R19_34830 [Bryobacteraceae bacterium]
MAGRIGCEIILSWIRMLNLTIELPDDSAARLEQQAALRGVSLKQLLESIAQEKAHEMEQAACLNDKQAAVQSILEIQKRVKPDPEGWTIRDYIDHGRR